MTTTELKPFLDDMLSMSTGPDGRTLQIHFCRPVTKEDRQAFADAHNAIVRGELIPSTPRSHVVGSERQRLLHIRNLILETDRIQLLTRDLRAASTADIEPIIAKISASATLLTESVMAVSNGDAAAALTMKLEGSNNGQ